MNRWERRRAEREGRRMDTLERHNKPLFMGDDHYHDMANYGFSRKVSDNIQFAAFFTRSR
jgi:hypothetical protein